MPLCLSYVPIGVACGILLHAAGMNFLLTFLVSVMVFSGGAQFILASLLMLDAPISSIFMTLFFLELRYALLGSSLSKYMQNESQRFVWLFSVSMNDENYAVNYLKFATDKNWTPKDALMVEHYSLLSWAGGNMVGGLIGSAVHIDLEIVNGAVLVHDRDAGAQSLVTVDQSGFSGAGSHLLESDQEYAGNHHCYFDCLVYRFHDRKYGSPTF